MTVVSNDPSNWPVISANRVYSYYTSSLKSLCIQVDGDVSLHLCFSQLHLPLQWYMIGVSQAPTFPNEMIDYLRGLSTVLTFGQEVCYCHYQGDHFT